MSTGLALKRAIQEFAAALARENVPTGTVRISLDSELWGRLARNLLEKSDAFNLGLELRTIRISAEGQSIWLDRVEE